ncbi:bifunctional phosphopantothenoylcysteine decarboxylase/phosphopantothenate--cysteine ligase CoaBC [Cyclobacterium jeungdonense]|uniref:Coenzyme A biosynthesis bifunctional protein CoaBC n=1 Tax=Cyclobacterium jeungdonense TaxID=708087 RepID=A0ABT8C310_9BACT|nr:bifunctional phosphopantothenoylcysteine decarboxylase/phosphopantothenate--cysteine ligase CoaBC [Cyclobacterium jeungdonense]MDN3687101.1 bifunctional phosphopantothenoylcysteine decarboxylase/phosphopantothenate--cysteine ligase CoaBC [Cyclobacterium jeungdonense]
MPLSGKRILLGVTGGIAAYKTAHLIRLLIKKGAEVKVIMTTSALSFISPLTLATLSKGPVFHDFFNKNTGEWTNHVELGNWADLMVIAPLSANTLAKMASGQSDNLLLCTYLSCTCPVLVAPAMDLDMYRHPAVSQNLAALRQYGHVVMEAATGELASGLSGQGRMPEPEDILSAVFSFFLPSSSSLKGKKIMITAGPTRESLDPVRYISNHSSGKMGISLAEKAAERGAIVTLILGPTSLAPTHPSIQTIPVSTAIEMFTEAKKSHPQSDIAIFTAAVSDYRPENPSPEKIKKKDGKLNLTLVKNPDIARNLGQEKKTVQVHVGFALETDEGFGSAEEKLKTKNFDFIVLNSLLDPEAGFQKDTNQVTFIDKKGKSQKSPVLRKEELASIILDKIESFFQTTES